MTKLVITIKERGPHKFELWCEQDKDGSETPLECREAVNIAVDLKNAIARKAEYSNIEELPTEGQS